MPVLFKGGDCCTSKLEVDCFSGVYVKIGRIDLVLISQVPCPHAIAELRTLREEIKCSAECLLVLRMMHDSTIRTRATVLCRAGAYVIIDERTLTFEDGMTALRNQRRPYTWLARSRSALS